MKRRSFLQLLGLVAPTAMKLPVSNALNEFESKAKTLNLPAPKIFKAHGVWVKAEPEHVEVVCYGAGGGGGKDSKYISLNKLV